MSLIKRKRDNTIVYILPGNPMTFSRGDIKTLYFQSQKDITLKYGIIISNQHDDKPFYKGPIQLVVDFFFDYPQKRREDNEQAKSLYHTTNPSLSGLVRFIEKIAENVLYGNECTIAAIVANKYYDRQSRTEFYIKELPNGK